LANAAGRSFRKKESVPGICLRAISMETFGVS
jgi:hypothetical protein